ncbi:hypothetical protein HY485_03555 [Candidatus Woesearchaeota archaeon]|nr:hypothetical protein [Candidatus Woesearchaeota archaeon]
MEVNYENEVFFPSEDVVKYAVESQTHFKEPDHGITWYCRLDVNREYMPDDFECPVNIQQARRTIGELVCSTVGTCLHRKLRENAVMTANKKFSADLEAEIDATFDSFNLSKERKSYELLINKLSEEFYDWVLQSPRYQKIHKLSVDDKNQIIKNV